MGADFRQYWQLDDTILEINLTPNRGDCLSVAGIAREVSVITRTPLIPVSTVPLSISYQNKDILEIHLEAPKACPRYLSQIIKNINNQAQTPLWMKLILERAGIRSIHPVVDVTNYVLLELGQPMHAFDLAKLNGSIHIRYAKKDEKLKLLNQQEVHLDEKTLVIADDKNALAMAGVMGGLDSSVTTETQDIVLESAFFTPEMIAGKARHYGLNTDSSHRFERGIDPEGQHIALNRAVALLLEIVGGDVCPVSEVNEIEYLPKLRRIELKQDKLERYLSRKFQRLNCQRYLNFRRSIFLIIKAFGLFRPLYIDMIYA